MPLQVLDHPLAGHIMAGLRDADTPPERFRTLAKRLTTLLVLQATAGLRTRVERVKTPLMETEAKVLDQSLAAVPILRAGLGMLEPVVELFPEVAVGYVGLERHEETAIARSYYSKLPEVRGRYCLCLDPMLATGGSASQAVSLIRAAGAETVVMVCVVAAPEGVAKFEASHPGVLIVTAALDEGLNDRKYILPGLGDFGDRLYGTG
ncbi:uracil phosphoribosyltransferase [bacterium]|nr:MAG: uracil phosphoribosyltransferase [bacterium]